MARGGYRRPEHPAPVSGPGRLARRTDGGPADKQAERRLPNAAYGENKQFQQDEAGAAMAGPSITPAAGPSLADIVPLHAPSTRPDEPVTTGMGDLSDMLSQQPQTLQQADSADMSYLLPGLEVLSSMPDSRPSTRYLYRRLLASQQPPVPQ